MRTITIFTLVLYFYVSQHTHTLHFSYFLLVFCCYSNKKKLNNQKGEIQSFLIAKRIPVNTLNEALKQATVTLQNTTKKDIVKFQRNKIKSFIRSERHTYEREQEGSIFTPRPRVLCLYKTKCVWRPPHLRRLKMFLQMAVNKVQACYVPV